MAPDAEPPVESHRPPGETATEGRARSPQEAFDALRGSIEAMGRRIGALGETTESLRREVREVLADEPAEAARAMLESLMRLHDIVFTRVTSMEGGPERPDGFVVNLLANLEGELLRQNIVVIRPHPGERVNLDVMSFVDAAPCAWWRQPDTVARVRQCGFAQEDDRGVRIIRKARVDVYRRT